jgi:hypothetical protein
MTTIPDVPGSQSEPATKFTLDAQERMARLRSMAAEFPDDADPKPLTTAELRLARGTTVTTLENAALILDAAPALGRAVGSSEDLREAIAFELAYGGVRDEARALARSVDLAIARRKLRAAKAARGLYRVAKGFITIDAGDSVRPHVAEMKRSLRGRRSRKPAPTAETPTATKH